MLWRKTWLETRWRFIIGFAVLMVLGGGIVFDYPLTKRLMPMAETIAGSGVLGRTIRATVDLERSYRGFVWVQWFRQNLTQTWTLFAVLLGSGSAVSQGSEAAAIFTLSLPVLRRRLLEVRVATGLTELAVLAFIPSLCIPLLSPAIGEHYAISEAMVHSACIFVGGTAFFSLAILLSTVFDDLWRPLLLACAAAVALAAFELVLVGRSAYGLVGAMTAEVYFRSGRLPWPGLVIAVAASGAMLSAAARNLARRDF